MPIDMQACITMGHGAGGRMSSELIASIFQKHFHNPYLAQGNDQAVLDMPAGRVVMATDSHVISPMVFPGGDIGALSIHGTINDIAMSGAQPLYISAAFVLEEGLPLHDLEQVVISMAKAACDAGVSVVTGDTKVVERGHGDGIFITTTGIGVLADGVHISGDLARAGDVIIVSGTLGDHGMAILAARQTLALQSTLCSDSAALHGLVAAMLDATPQIHCLRDPTRGGLASVLHEWALQSDVGMEIHEQDIPVRDEVRAVCELLGFDPLYIANEGKLVCVCAAEDAHVLLSVMRAHPLGRDACVIGKVSAEVSPRVRMRTAMGGLRVVDWLAADQLPRIC